MENNQRNSRKRLNSLILLVAFTAVMLIVSTYAWFSAQKNVTIGGLKGKVNVAEGLEISLDAKYWSQEIDFTDDLYKSADGSQEKLKKIYASGKTLQDGNLEASDAEHNIIPTDLVPVSTTGNTGDGIGQPDMNMYRGINQNTKELYEIIKVKQATHDADREDGYVYAAEKYAENATTPITSSHHDYPGYYAIDLFLRNSTADVSTSDDDPSANDGVSIFNKLSPLQLNANSVLQLQSAGSNSTGLQNTVRVAFALYNMEETYDALTDVSWETGEEHNWNNAIAKAACTASAYMTASQEQILNAYAGQKIHDVAIWEPNATDHVDYIVTNNNNVTFSGDATTGDIKTYGIGTGASETVGKFGTSTPIPTYALTSTALTLSKTDPDTNKFGEEGEINVVKVGEGTGATPAVGMTNIYDWKTPYTGLAKQVTLQTQKIDDDNYSVGKVKQLISVTSTPENRYTIGDSTVETGAKAFSIPKGKVCKIRMYVWLEGQDVDTINHASHGGGIYLDVGLLKDGTAQS